MTQVTQDYSTIDQAHVALDALTLLQAAIDAGSKPWLDYEGDEDDPKVSEDGYKSILTETCRKLSAMIGLEPSAPQCPALGTE